MPGFETGSLRWGGGTETLRVWWVWELGSLYGLSGMQGVAEVGEQVSGFCRDPLEGRALPVSSITQHQNEEGTNTTHTTHSVASSTRLSVSGSASPDVFCALFPSRGQEGAGNELLTLQG